MPKDPSEITFVTIPTNLVHVYDANGKITTTRSYPKAYTAQEQSDAFFAYINQDKYLSTRKGQYAERNGGVSPWRNQFDLRIVQDIFKNIGSTKNSFQFTADIFNLGNFLNKNWGEVNFVRNANILVPQNVSSISNTVKPTFIMASSQADMVKETFGTNQTITSTYYMQFGVRYNFN